MNTILGGGGFSSRIVETIRNDRGLAYFAGSFYQPGTIDKGAFVGLSMTQADSTTVALELLMEEIERIRREEVEEEELETAKNMRLNSQVFSYDSSSEIVNCPNMKGTSTSQLLLPDGGGVEGSSEISTATSMETGRFTPSDTVSVAV